MAILSLKEAGKKKSQEKKVTDIKKKVTDKKSQEKKVTEKKSHKKSHTLTHKTCARTNDAHAHAACKTSTHQK